MTHQKAPDCTVRTNYMLFKRRVNKAYEEAIVQISNIYIGNNLNVFYIIIRTYRNCFLLLKLMHRLFFYLNNKSLSKNAIFVVNTPLQVASETLYSSLQHTHIMFKQQSMYNIYYAENIPERKIRAVSAVHHISSITIYK